MKDPLEVLRRKEAELRRLQEEVEALRRVGKMVGEKRIGIERIVAKVFPGVPVENIGPINA